MNFLEGGKSFGFPCRSGVPGPPLVPSPTLAVYPHPWNETYPYSSYSDSIVLLLVFLGPRWLITLPLPAWLPSPQWNTMGMAERGGSNLPRVAVLSPLSPSFLGNFYYFEQTAAIFGCLSLGLLVYCTFRSKSETMIADAALSVFCFFYAGLTLLSLPGLREEANGPSL